METKFLMEPMSCVEMENIYGGLNWKAAFGTIKGTAGICGGLMLGNPIGVISGCLETRYNAGKIFD